MEDPAFSLLVTVPMEDFLRDRDWTSISEISKDITEGIWFDKLGSEVMMISKVIPFKYILVELWFTGTSMDRLRDWCGDVAQEPLVHLTPVNNWEADKLEKSSAVELVDNLVWDMDLLDTVMADLVDNTSSSDKADIGTLSLTLSSFLELVRTFSSSSLEFVRTFSSSS